MALVERRIKRFLTWQQYMSPFSMMACHAYLVRTATAHVWHTVSIVHFFLYLPLFFWGLSPHRLPRNKMVKRDIRMANYEKRRKQAVAHPISLLLTMRQNHLFPSFFMIYHPYIPLPWGTLLFITCSYSTLR